MNRFHKIIMLVLIGILVTQAITTAQNTNINKIKYIDFEVKTLDSEIQTNTLYDEDYNFDIIGGIGCKLEIVNLLDVEIQNLNWSLEIKGGLFGFIDLNESGTVDIPAGYLERVADILIIGFGKITAKAIVGDETHIDEGFQLIISTKLE